MVRLGSLRPQNWELDDLERNEIICEAGLLDLVGWTKGSGHLGREVQAIERKWKDLFPFLWVKA